MTTALSVLAVLPAADVDEISIAFDESSMIVLRIVIATILFGIALDTRVSDFRAALRRPGAIGIALLAQFLILPALTFLLTLALDVDGGLAPKSAGASLVQSPVAESLSRPKPQPKTTSSTGSAPSTEPSRSTSKSRTGSFGSRTFNSSSSISTTIVRTSCSRPSVTTRRGA